MTVAHRFIGGIEVELTSQSVKRTAELNFFWNHVHSVVRFTDSRSKSHLVPSAEALGYFPSVRFADEKGLLRQSRSIPDQRAPGIWSTVKMILEFPSGVIFLIRGNHSVRTSRSVCRNSST